MMNDSIDDIKTFDTHREEFAPYGLTCEKWEPQPIPRIDRHNEIEINFFPSGGATYVISNRKVNIPPRKLVVFWALMPHKTIEFTGSGEYYVCTIPLTTFLSWKVSEEMQHALLEGQVLTVPDESMAKYDEQLLCMWRNDLSHTNSISAIQAATTSSTDANYSVSAQIRETVTMEIKSRMKRFSLQYDSISAPVLTSNLEEDVKQQGKDKQQGVLCSNYVDTVSRIAIFIAQNYYKPIKTKDIGAAVGLHPDYANTLFRKAFSCTLHEYLLLERVNNVQRLLLTTDLPITEIGLACGFSTIARFNATFLSLCGCTPREYRRMLEKG